MEFKDRVAIITGAASGIGRACALELARGGASVVVVDVAGEDVMIQTSHQLKETGARVATYNADVTDHGKAARIVAEARARMGRVDMLINAAGINSDAPLWEMTESQWDRVVNINLKGTFNYLHAAARLFREQKSGKIVNIASIQALRGSFGISNYAASKAGVIGLTKSAARDLGRSNVNVNAVAPGFVRTPMFERLPQQIQDEAEREAALGRIAEPVDVANLAAFLCSERARHITGAVITIDGGQSL
ncbi:MAG TPA: SDR family NAD(P)-dependent oxidoreductase [Pyrinomonadaceae bacterium]|jgi:3-oxoacyl-[acyl-carrier protein] reductase